MESRRYLSTYLNAGGVQTSIARNSLFLWSQLALQITSWVRDLVTSCPSQFFSSVLKRCCTTRTAQKACHFLVGNQDKKCPALQVSVPTPTMLVWVPKWTPMAIRQQWCHRHALSQTVMFENQGVFPPMLIVLKQPNFKPLPISPWSWETRIWYHLETTSPSKQKTQKESDLDAQQIIYKSNWEKGVLRNLFSRMWLPEILVLVSRGPISLMQSWDIEGCRWHLQTGTFCWGTVNLTFTIILKKPYSINPSAAKLHSCFAISWKRYTVYITLTLTPYKAFCFWKHSAWNQWHSKPWRFFVCFRQVGSSVPGRRLFIGSGIGGTGVQCGVDVGFIVDNIYVSRVQNNGLNGWEFFQDDDGRTARNQAWNYN